MATALSRYARDIGEFNSCKIEPSIDLPAHPGLALRNIHYFVYPFFKKSQYKIIESEENGTSIHIKLIRIVISGKVYEEMKEGPRHFGKPPMPVQVHNTFEAPLIILDL